MMRDLLARLFSRRVRELERANADLRAMLDGNFDAVSLTRMTYDPVDGFRAEFKSSVGGLFAAWAFNALKAADAKNFVEFTLWHPEGGFLTITAQRRSGETPGAKAARLEHELEQLRAA